MGVDLHQLSNALRKAIAHKVVLPINASQYFSLPLSRRYEALSSWRNDSPHRFFSENTVFVDQEGTALIWYLPNLLPKHFKNNIFAATTLIDRKLAIGIQGSSATTQRKKKGSSTNQSWRRQSTLFPSSKKKPTVRPGVANFSFGWRPCGKGWSKEEDVASSVSLKEPVSEIPSTQSWLRRIKDLQLTTSLILSVIHPDLFDAAKEVLDFCVEPSSHNGKTHEWASLWNSVYTAMTIISGRITPEHVDSLGRSHYLDALVSLGNAANPKMIFRELNASFSYKSGTALFFAGKGWTHEVPEWGPGERVCYASYLRPEMIEAHGQCVSSWGLKV
ncbi:hypothetical protein VKT23_020253 [Stygiomarasmius scandens]|uniref:Uncharacterized protein n=1 Tax=Marasmiellus scandens TaxID=2682957 RepID=A0ABR1IM07_9AGAR